MRSVSPFFRVFSLPRTACVLAAGLLLAGCFEKTPETSPEVPPRPIAWIEVEAAKLEQLRRIPGVVQAAEQASLSFEVGGKVKSVLVSLGDRVVRGQLLAELDESSYQLSSTASEGQLQEARANLRESERNYERQVNLHRDGWISAAALDNAEAALERARSNVKIAEAQLNLTRKDLGDTSLKAPYDGVITERVVEPSQQVTAGQAILEIEGSVGLEISVMAPETLVGSLNQGSRFEIGFPAVPDLSGSAEVTEISARAETANAFPVTLRLLDAPPELRAGMSAEVDFVFEGAGQTGYTGEIIRIPPTAIIAGEADGAYAFVFDPQESVVRKRRIQTENIFNNDVQVSQGLSAGEIIAVAGLPYLHDGQKVRLMGVGPRTLN